MEKEKSPILIKPNIKASGIKEKKTEKELSIFLMAANIKDNFLWIFAVDLEL